MEKDMTCVTCNGEGVSTHHENQSPLGSGMVWLEKITEDDPTYLEWALDDIKEFELTNKAMKTLKQALGQVDPLKDVF